MKWFRHDAARRMHPKFRAAGFWGASAVDAAWEFACMFDRDDGDVTDFWTAPTVAAWLQAAGEDLQRIAAGMVDAVGAGLVDSVDGHYVIHDWSTSQPEPSRVRVRKHRERLKPQPDVTNVTNVTNRVTDVTPTVHTVHTDITNSTDSTDPTNRSGKAEEHGELFPVGPHRPDAEAIATADHLRSALLMAGATCPGFRQAGSYSKRKRGEWAVVLNGAAMDHGLSQQDIRETIDWACSAPSWDIGGETWTWVQVLDVANAAGKLAEKLQTIRARRARATEPLSEQRTRFPSAPVNPTRCTACGALMLYPDEGCDRCKAALAAGGVRA